MKITSWLYVLKALGIYFHRPYALHITTVLSISLTKSRRNVESKSSKIKSCFYVQNIFPSITCSLWYKININKHYWNLGKFLIQDSDFQNKILFLCPEGFGNIFPYIIYYVYYKSNINKHNWNTQKFQINGRGF